MNALIGIIKRRLSRLYRKFIVTPWEIDALYGLLYRVIHDSRSAPSFVAAQTESAFDYQWKELADGEAMLSDAWFKENIEQIVCNEELLIKPEWFKGKRVLDCGCGGGRWSYAFALLGAHVTAIDVNRSALDATRRALDEIEVEKKFVCCPLEELSENLSTETKFDLVFSRGVLHHCRSFDQSLAEIIKFVADPGVIYLYLFSRDSFPFDMDLEEFKQRVRYNSLQSVDARKNFLLKRRDGDPTKLHQAHDYYSPLISRRHEYSNIEKYLLESGFARVERTIPHKELYVRAIKGDAEEFVQRWSLPPSEPPFWFDRYN